MALEKERISNVNSNHLHRTGWECGHILYQEYATYFDAYKAVIIIQAVYFKWHWKIVFPLP